MKRIHFIAIGGAAMHNIAIALKQKGYKISGSDDEIFEPSLSRLKENGLLPSNPGWFSSNITNDLDAVILGMHARPDNPELIRAKELNLKIYSYPEFLYEQTSNKKRVVIAGSHGKTTITAMVIHVLKFCGMRIDFMAGSQISGFDNMVSLNDDAKVAVFEGDEYLSSPIDKRSKFIHYKPDIAVITGIAWDHINVFPSFENYIDTFRDFIKIIEKDGNLVYYEGDEVLRSVVLQDQSPVIKHPYREHTHIIKEGNTFLINHNGQELPVHLIGNHNMQNISAAKNVCSLLGVSEEMFFKAIQQFQGTSKRLQILKKTSDCIVFLDFAHAPSKVKATVNAVRNQYPERKITVIFELHTFSSLNKQFLPQYKGALDGADKAVVFYNKEVLLHKKMPPLSEKYVKDCFSNNNIQVISEIEALKDYVTSVEHKDSILLLMSSGNFGGIDFKSCFNF